MKANQPGLLARCKALPWAKIRAATLRVIPEGAGPVKRCYRPVFVPLRRILRLTGTNDIARATRHHARNPARPVQLLLTS